MLTLTVACCISCMTGNASGIEEKAENAVGTPFGDIFDSFPKVDCNQKGFLPKNLDAIEADAVCDSLSTMKMRNAEREEFLDTRQEEKGQKGQADKIGKERSLDKGSTELRQLQVPEKLEVVVDPWEMDGKDQIYSKPYVIRNMGETPGTLTLSGLSCVPRENSGVQVRSERMGLHEGKEKAVYMQITIGDGKEIVLSEESEVYQIRLQPGEELSLYITGEVNENALEEWKDSDLTVHVAYLWEAEDTVVEEERTKEETEGSEKEPVVGRQKEKLEEYERDTESEIEIESEDIEQTEEAGNKAEIDESESEEIEKIEEKVAQDPLTEEEEQTDGIEVQDSGEVQLKVDAWETDEDGITCSRMYKMRNTGVRAGMFSLIKIVDDTEATEILVQPEGGLSNGNGVDGIYMELIAKTGEELPVPNSLQEIFSQEDSIEPKHDIELSSGEEVMFRIVIRKNIVELENMKDRVLTLVGSWTVEEGEGLTEHVR